MEKIFKVIKISNGLLVGNYEKRYINRENFDPIIDALPHATFAPNTDAVVAFAQESIKSDLWLAQNMFNGAKEAHFKITIERIDPQ